MKTILIHPPIAKPSEAPGGLARLAGALGRHGVPHTLLDANLEGLLALVEGPSTADDRWTQRAVRHRARHLAALRAPALYRSPDRYRRAVADINRLVETAPAARGFNLTLTNYQDPGRSPLSSDDLLRAARQPQTNPFYPYFSRRLEALFEREQPAVVGFSLNYLSQALCTFAMLGFVRRQWPGLTLVVGGSLVTSWMRRPGWQNRFAEVVDHLVAGPGEQALLALLGATANRALPSYRPDYAALPLDAYLAPGPILPYSASSGCYWNRCAFCPERAEETPYTAVPPPEVLADLEALTARTRPVLIHLLDNAISPALLAALAARPPGTGWYGFARIDRRLADPVFCRALKRSGCVMLKLGLESGDQGVLDGERKGIDLDVASRALRCLARAGIATYVYLLFGTPSETLPAARATLAFTVRHADAIGFLNLALFNLPLGDRQVGALARYALSDGDLSLYTGFRHPRGWDRDIVRRFVDKEFKRHPVVRRILRRDPPLFTSNHAPFFAPGRRL